MRIPFSAPKARQKSAAALESIAMLAFLFAAVVLATTVASCQAISAPHAATALYVSPDGDDGNPGSQARPVRTLQRARDLVRSLNQRMSGDITVYLSTGVYRLSKPLELDASDSGMNGHNVIYTSLSEERPVISGGAQVTGWKVSNAAKNIWSAPAPAALNNTRQLFVNGVRAQRARGVLPFEVMPTSTGYVAGSAAMSEWRNQSDIEFVYTGGNAIWSERSYGLGPWTEPRCPVASIKGTTITMARPCWDNSTKRIMLPNGARTANLVGPASVGKRPAYIENAFELLGTPGQWYFDRSARLIYYVPRAGEDLRKADAEVPVLEKLISAQGAKDSPVHNLVFSHLQFSYGTWLQPSTSEGFSEIQANFTVTGPEGYAKQGLCKLVPDGACPFGAWTKIPGNVSFTNDTNVQFLNDAFVHLGAAGLELGNGSQSDLVQGCVFTDISGNGLELGDVNLPLATGGDVTRDNQVLNNHIYEIAAEYHGGVGIWVGYAQRTTIKHQQIDHIPYTGVSFGWGGWPDKIKQAGQSNVSEKNALGHSLIFDHMLLLADGGGIYTQGLTGSKLSEGEKIYATVVRDQFGSGHGIYTDNGSCNITIDHNVIFNTNFDNWGSRHGNYYNGGDGKNYDPLDVRSNYWQQGTPDSAAKDVTVKDNRIITSIADAPASIVDNAGLQPNYKKILDEKFSAGAPEPPMRVAAAAGNGIAYVAWNPPILQGGAPVESYTVTSSKGDKVTVPAADLWNKGYAVVSGLTNSTEYTFTVTAANANGSSSPSLPSQPISLKGAPIHVPSAPRNVKAYAEGGAVSIHFQAPEDNGGSPVTAYTFIVHPTERKVAVTGRSVLTLDGKHTMFGVVGGLQSGQSYSFDVAAENAAGQGATATTDTVSVRPNGPSAAQASR